MRLNAFTDIGLRALMRLAGEEGGFINSVSLSRELCISRHHLIKVVQALAAGGFVQIRRGAHGGFRLARPAEQITIGEAIRVLEGDQPLVECFRADGGNCTLSPGCRLKGRLAVAREHFFVELDRATLAECAYPPLRH